MGKSARASSPGIEIGPTTVLVVDDNPADLKLAKVLMRTEGYGVRTADSAQAALSQLEMSIPRVILLDIQLPGMNGLELARWLATHPRRAEMVIIAVTAFAMKGDAERALAAGCDGYVSKPIDADTLLQMISQRLARTTTTSLKGRSLGLVSPGSSS